MSNYGALNKNQEECVYCAAFRKQRFASSAAPKNDICTRMDRSVGSLWKMNFRATWGGICTEELSSVPPHQALGFHIPAATTATAPVLGRKATPAKTSCQ